MLTEKGLQEKMNSNIFDLIKKYASELTLMENADDNTRKILLEFGGRYYETAEGADFAQLTKEDVVEISRPSVEEQLLRRNNKIKAVVISNTTYCSVNRKAGRTIKASLDDMAQIIGSKVKVVEYNAEEVSRALKKTAGCMVKDRYTLTTGRSLYEAVVALRVLEKSAEVNLKADVIGGVSVIASAEAKLMRMIYKKKYSKAEHHVKSGEGN